MLSLRRLLARLAGIGYTRLELLGVELQIELQRVLNLAVWAGVVLIAGGIALLLGGVTLIAVFWDSHRIVAALMVTAFFLAVSVGAAVTLAVKIRRRRPMFEATLAELKQDRARLRGEE